MEKEYPIFYKTVFGRRVIVSTSVTNKYGSGLILSSQQEDFVRQSDPRVKNKKLFTIFDGKELRL